MMVSVLSPIIAIGFQYPVANALSHRLHYCLVNHGLCGVVIPMKASGRPRPGISGEGAHPLRPFLR